MNEATNDIQPAGMSICEWFQESAIAACEKWDGNRNEDLMELIREEFGQTISQFYGLQREGDTWREMAALREELKEWKDKVSTTLEQLDELAEVWGDEGVFRRCRDRLRELVHDGNN